VIHDDEALHAQAGRDDLAVVAEALPLAGRGVVLADGAAVDDAGEVFGLGEGEVEDLAANYTRILARKRE
jgi:uncharacterized protein YgbK (DUF1537 family)